MEIDEKAAAVEPLAGAAAWSGRSARRSEERALRLSWSVDYSSSQTWYQSSRPFTLAVEKFWTSFRQAVRWLR